MVHLDLMRFFELSEGTFGLSTRFEAAISGVAGWASLFEEVFDVHEESLLALSAIYFGERIVGIFADWVEERS